MYGEKEDEKTDKVKSLMDRFIGMILFFFLVRLQDNRI